MPTSQESELMPLQASQHPRPKCHCCCAHASNSAFMATLHTPTFHTLLQQGNQDTRPQSCCCTASTGTPVHLHHCSTGAPKSDTKHWYGRPQAGPSTKRDPHHHDILHGRKRPGSPQKLSLLPRATAALATKQPCSLPTLISADKAAWRLHCW